VEFTLALEFTFSSQLILEKIVDKRKELLDYWNI